MVCRNCGNEVAPGTQQCPICGSRLDVNSNGFQSNGFEQNNGFNNQQGFNNGFNQQPNYDANQNNFQGGAFGTQPNNGFDNGQNWNNGQTWNQPTNTSAPAFVPLLVIGIVYSICCCNWVFGILGIIFSIIMNNAYKRGDNRAYDKMKTVAIVIYAIGAIGWILGLVFGLFDAIWGLISGIFTAIFG